MKPADVDTIERGEFAFRLSVRPLVDQPDRKTAHQSLYVLDDDGRTTTTAAHIKTKGRLSDRGAGRKGCRRIIDGNDLAIADGVGDAVRSPRFRLVVAAGDLNAPGVEVPGKGQCIPNPDLGRWPRMTANRTAPIVVSSAGSISNVAMSSLALRAISERSGQTWHCPIWQTVRASASRAPRYCEITWSAVTDVTSIEFQDECRGAAKRAVVYHSNMPEKGPSGPKHVV